MKSFKSILIALLIAQGPALYAADAGSMLSTILEDPTVPVAAAVGLCTAGYMAAKKMYAKRQLNKQLEQALTNNAPIEQIEALLKQGAMCSRPFERVIYGHDFPEGQMVVRLQLLIDYNADVNETNRFSATVLQTMANWGAPPAGVVGLLLDNGADTNRRFYDHVCAAFFLSKFSHRCLPLLKIVDKNGKTPLMMAISRRSERLIEPLTSRLPVASINARDHQGRTALMWSVIEHTSPSSWVRVNENTVKLLLDRGARVDMQDKTGTSVLMHAVKCDDPSAVIKLFLERAGDQITDNDLDTAIGSILLNIQELTQRGEGYEGLITMGYNKLALLQAEYVRRVHSAVQGLSSAEHARINSKLWRSEEQREIEALQKLIPAHELSVAGTTGNKTPGEINTLIAEYIADTRPSRGVAAGAAADPVDEPDDDQGGDELFSDFGVPRKRQGVAASAAAADHGAGLGLPVQPVAPAGPGVHGTVMNEEEFVPEID